MNVGMLLSGGLDSAILLGHLLEQGHGVQPFYVRSHLAWEREEFRAVRQLLAAMAAPGLAELVVLEMPVADLYEDHWSVTGRDVPDAGSPDSAVYLPGRNLLLLVKPAVWCRLHGIEWLALAVLGTNPFGDARPEFFADFESLLARATGGRVRLLRPFEQARQAASDGFGPPPPAGAHLLLPGARRRPALRAVQQVRRAPPGIPLRRTGRRYTLQYCERREMTRRLPYCRGSRHPKRRREKHPLAETR